MRGLELSCVILHYWIEKLVGENTLPPLVSIHACDSAPHCRRALRSFTDTWRPKHICKDILDRIPVDTLQATQKELPKPTYRKEAQRRQFDIFKTKATEYFETRRVAREQAVCDLHCSDGMHCDLFFEKRDAFVAYGDEVD